MSTAGRARRCPRALSRTAVVGVAAAASILLYAIPATAHVTVSPDTAPPGSAAVLTFHVPNEESGADTVRVDMQLPAGRPIAQLLVEPVPGWTISVRTTTLATPLVTDDGRFTQVVSEVIWSGGRIAPGRFQDFTLSADPLPQTAGRLMFKTVQTYSNGDVVRWIDASQPGQAEPDHPAPVLTLTSGAAGAQPAAGAASGTASSAAPASGGSDTTARGIAAAGVVIGLLGLALAGLSRRRDRAAITPEPSASNGHAPVLAPVAEPTPEPPEGAGTQRAGAPAREATGRARAGGNRRNQR